MISSLIMGSLSGDGDEAYWEGGHKVLTAISLTVCQCKMVPLPPTDMQDRDLMVA
jgi:hypothetical protein